MISAATQLPAVLELSYRRIRAAYSGDLLMHDKCRKPLAYKGHLITVSGVMSPGQFSQEPLQGDGWLLTPRERWPHGTVSYPNLLDAWNEGTVERGDQSGHLVRYRSRDLVLTRHILLTDHNWSWELEHGQYRDRSLELEYAAVKVSEDGRAQLGRQGVPAFIPLGHHRLAEVAIQYAARLLDAQEVRPGILTAGRGQRYQIMPREDLDAFVKAQHQEPVEPPSPMALNL